ncbi:MAG: cation:proton antiporter [Bdellovibrionales bacterium]|nr:cation:proton antiporter [Bdellovibrionales bacterium]
MVESILLVMSLLVAGFLGTRIAKIVNMPHSVFLVIAGIAAAFAFRYFSPEEVAHLKHLFPEIILFVLLPPLVFESAYNFDFADLKKDLVPISFYAVIALCLSTSIIGASFYFLFGLQLVPSLVFGALISATDPVAVVSLFKQIGAPKRLNTLIEGESLFNDGTAIVLYRVLIGFASATVFKPEMVSEGLIQFITVAGGGVLTGFVLYYLTSLFLRFVSDSSAQLGLTVAAAYISFIVADHVLHVSGVIATMVVGLCLGNKARLEFNREALHGMHYIWEFLALSANTIVFFAVGLNIDVDGLRSSLVLVLPALGIIYFSRAFAVYGLTPLLNLTRLTQPINLSYQTFIVWGGLRGGLALALVLLLPNEFPHKDLFLSLASAVVLSTLFLNALTIQRMLSWFGLDKLDFKSQRVYLKILKKVIQSSTQTFEKAHAAGQYSADIIERQKNTLNQLLEKQLHEDAQGATEYEDELLLEEALEAALLKEQSIYNHEVENGVLSKKAYIELMLSLKSRKQIFEAEKIKGLNKYSFSSLTNLKSHFLANFKNPIFTLSTRLEILLHLHLALKEVQKIVAHDEAKKLLNAWVQLASRGLEQFYTLYPDHSASIQTQYLSNAVTYNSELKIEEYLHDDVITASIATRLRQDIEASNEKQSQTAQELLKPSLSYLLHRVPLFATAPNELISKLCAKVTTRFLQTGQTIVSEGDAGSSFFLVTAGILEVRSEKLAEQGILPRLFVGDFFGEVSLVFGQPRNATIVASMPSQVIEISEEIFRSVLADAPQILEEITKVAKERHAA